MSSFEYDIDTNKGLIDSVRFKNNELIYPWSIEFGDPASFFSLEQPGWRTSINKKNISVSENEITGELEVVTSSGSGLLSWRDSIDKNKVSRRASLQATEDLLLMDFVIQYRFKADQFPKAKINGEVYSHQNRNLYIQYPVDSVELFGDEVSVKINTTDSHNNDKFQQEMYVRDRGDMWIVHSRLMPTSDFREPDLETIKLNTRWYNRALPTPVAKLLLKVPGVRKTLWYRGEIKGYPWWNPILRLFKPSAYIFSKLNSGEHLSLNTGVEFYETA